jgi:hypothetical protein
MKTSTILSSSLGTTLSTALYYAKISARLGPLKLRKFVDFYSENYPKAKDNRKLMAAIQMAEERLRQNDQDVQVFE